MAVLSLAEFNDKLRILDYTLTASENAQTTRTIGGAIYRSSRGSRVWAGQINCAPASHSTQRQFDGLIDKIQTVGNFFLYTPAKAEYPQAYKLGDNLSAVQANGAQAAGYSLKLKGLPGNFQLTQGDYLSFVINGVHRLYRLTDSVKANATGLATVTLNIPLTSGALPVANAAITLVRPTLTCTYVTDSYSPAKVVLSHTEGFSFSFQQVYRT